MPQHLQAKSRETAQRSMALLLLKQGNTQDESAEQSRLSIGQARYLIRGT